MRLSEAMRRTGGAARATGGAVRSGARAGATAGRRTGGFVHRVTGASGAGRTGLSTLIELTAAGGAGDAFVAVSLAGTIFFSTSVDQARGRVVLFLLVTMAPFAVLAPFIGPALDRMQQGRRYLLAGTLLARGLLCWGMSAAIHSPVTLLPAAFGILVLQKAYGVAARVGHAPPAARGNQPGHRERAVPALHPDRLHARRRAGGGDPGHGRGRLGAPGGHADLPRRHVPRAAAPRPGGLAAGSRRHPGSGRRRSPARFLPERAWAIRPGRRRRPVGGRTRLGWSGRPYHPVRAGRPPARRPPTRRSAARRRTR